METRSPAQGSTCILGKSDSVTLSGRQFWRFRDWCHGGGDSLTACKSAGASLPHPGAELGSRQTDAGVHTLVLWG